MRYQLYPKSTKIDELKLKISYLDFFSQFYVINYARHFLPYLFIVAVNYLTLLIESYLKVRSVHLTEM